MIGDIIMQKREEKGLSIKQLSIKSRLRASTLLSIESNKKPPTPEQLNKIAIALDCKANDFFTDGTVNFGQVIQDFRLSKEFSVDKLALLSGLSSSQIYSLEINQIAGTQEHFDRLSSVFGCSPYDIVPQDYYNSLPKRARIKRRKLTEIEANTTPIGRKIRKLRKEKGILKKEIANKVGVSLGTVTRWETGSYKVLPTYIDKLAEVLGVTIEYLSNDDVK